MPVDLASAKTQLQPGGYPGRLYGDFTGKTQPVAGGLIVASPDSWVFVLAEDNAIKVMPGGGAIDA